MKLHALVGSGGKIGWFTLAFLVVGLVVHALWPALLRVGPTPRPIQVLAAIVLALGVAIWFRSVARGGIILGIPFVRCRRSSPPSSAPPSGRCRPG